MRKILALILSLLLLATLCGCKKEAEEPTEVATKPTLALKETTAPTEAATQPTEEGAILKTAVLRSEDPELTVEFALLAVNSEGPFHSENVKFNDAGADALIRWLLTEQNQTKLAEFGLAEFGEAVYRVAEDEPTSEENEETEPSEPTVPAEPVIPQATEENAKIQFAVADSFLQSGILEDLLTEFEETYGYEVEVRETSATGALAVAKLAMFDLVLTEASPAVETFVEEGYARIVEDFETATVSLCSADYVLCGPTADPAGAANCKSLKAAMAAIAKGQYIFLSRGDDSSLHKFEQTLWPEKQEFGSWYLAMDTESGPLLVMNELENGYLLVEKLTWLQFFHADGIL